MSKIDSSNAGKAQPLRGGGTKGRPIKPSENGYNSHVRNYAQLLGGVYFGNPLTEGRAEARNYSDTNFSDSENHKYTFFILNGEKRLSETPELDFLYAMIVKKSQDSDTQPSDPKIHELAGLAGAKEKRGSQWFYVTAIRNNDAGGLEANSKQKDTLRGQFGIWNTKSSSYLGMKDDNSKKKLYEMDRANQKAAREGAGLKEKLIARYQMVTNNKSFEGADQESMPNIKLKKFIPSRIRNFYKRAIKRFSSGYAETSMFLKNIGNLNPEFEGPFITTDIQYYRPAKKEDFDIESGVDSISISQGNDGVVTSIKYSSRKFGEVDDSLVTDYLGGTANIPNKRFEPNAFQKNIQGR